MTEVSREFDDYLAPIDQLFYLCKEIYDEIDHLSKPFIVIGGQAVSYWLEYFDLDQRLTSAQRAQATSIDIDFCGNNEDFQLISDKWEVLIRRPTIDDATPEQGVCLLRHRETHEIKSIDGLFYLDIGELFNNNQHQPNQVDFLSLPNGFEIQDFENRKLVQHTEMLEFPPEFELASRENLLVLNPIGCIKSRMYNYYRLKAVRDPELELARIKLLLAPLSLYLQKSLLENGFKATQPYIKLAMQLAKSRLGVEIAVNHGIDISQAISHFVEEQQSTLPEKFLTHQFANWKQGLDAKVERKVVFYSQ
ncbi:hypothetical protein OPW36_06310 [Vibrio europaeus]|uniref:hypothetical protein n=1 Tax=Vibrio europaeus TaxID=300876 RepID=UPI00233E664F|nr:hypothetical protein [Vibrio europaeus]MDC5808116.1 hypothetical protein [Vibrio europaeus]MDC5824334.1 hypothetical protein [Vibrio europaeus]MDC5832798.1 hypothetical protein [Vibrio europaeus]MDC5837676.1 hypothetical protein [Vibrio europaeus]